MFCQFIVPNRRHLHITGNFRLLILGFACVCGSGVGAACGFTGTGCDDGCCSRCLIILYVIVGVVVVFSKALWTASFCRPDRLAESALRNYWM